MNRGQSLTRARRIARDCLGVRQRLLARLVSATFESAMRHLGITIGQMNMLVAIAATGPVTARDLSRRLVLEKSTVSRDLRYLVRKGWIESSSGDDARMQHLTVTRQGLTVIDDAYPSWVEGQKAAEQLLGSVLAVATMEAADRYWQSVR